jgi:hypothetical protein
MAAFHSIIYGRFWVITKVWPELFIRVWLQFEQLEPSLAKIEQLFKTSWICALRGQAALAPHNAWLVGRGIADIAFLLQAHRCSIWCRCIAGSGARLEHC